MRSVRQRHRCSEPSTVVLDVFRINAGILQGFLEGNVPPSRTIGEETRGATVHTRSPVLGGRAKSRRCPHLRAETVLGVVRCVLDTRTSFLQRCGNLVLTRADGRDDTDAGDDDATHGRFLVIS